MYTRYAIYLSLSRVLVQRSQAGNDAAVAAAAVGAHIRETIAPAAAAFWPYGERRTARDRASIAVIAPRATCTVHARKLRKETERERMQKFTCARVYIYAKERGVELF